MERRIAEIRDGILISCIDGNHEKAVLQLDELFGVISNTEVPENVRNELVCRYWESKLDVSAISSNPISEVISTLEVILELPEFNPNRRKEIIKRGLKKIGEISS